MWENYAMTSQDSKRTKENTKMAKPSEKGNTLAQKKTEEQTRSLPVIIVPGWGAPHLHTKWVARLLESEGFRAYPLKLPRFGVGDTEENAAILAREIERVCSKEGQKRVNLLGMSLGGLIVRIYLEENGPDRIGRAAFIKTPHDGIYTAYPASFTKGGRQIRKGSKFIKELNATKRCSCESPRCLSVYLSRDLIICPAKAAVLPCGYNLELEWPVFHWGLVLNPRLIKKAARFLAGEIPEGAKGPEMA